MHESAKNQETLGPFNSQKTTTGTEPSLREARKRGAEKSNSLSYCSGSPDQETTKQTLTPPCSSRTLSHRGASPSAQSFIPLPPRQGTPKNVPRGSATGPSDPCNCGKCTFHPPLAGSGPPERPARSKEQQNRLPPPPPEAMSCPSSRA